MGKKMRKAIKRLSKDLDEMREENRELVEGLAERLTEALERQAESNRVLTETLESYLKSLDLAVPEREIDGGADEDQGEEAEVPKITEREAREPGGTWTT